MKRFISLFLFSLIFITSFSLSPSNAQASTFSIQSHPPYCDISLQNEQPVIVLDSSLYTAEANSYCGSNSYFIYENATGAYFRNSAGEQNVYRLLSLVNDFDGDGIPNSTDLDDDNDGTPDSTDPYPLDRNRGGSNDPDGDGIPNSTDNDDDGDGTPDGTDPYPLDPNRGGADSDGDGTPDATDPYPLDPSPRPYDPNADDDGDGIPNGTDPDDDGDGIPDPQDPNNPPPPPPPDDPNDPDPDEDAACDPESGGDNFFSFLADKMVGLLPRSPDAVRLPTILSNMMGQGSLAGSLAVELYSGVWQYLAIIAFIKFYQLIPGKFT